MLHLINKFKSKIDSKYFYASLSAVALIVTIALVLIFSTGKNSESEKSAWSDLKKSSKQKGKSTNSGNETFDNIDSENSFPETASKSDKKINACSNDSRKADDKNFALVNPAAKRKPKETVKKIGSKLSNVKLSDDDFKKLKNSIADLISKYDRNKKSVVGAQIFDLVRKENLCAYNSSELFIPASNQKIVTTLAGLEKLGSDYKFPTKIYLLEDTLILVGDFDPTLGDPVLCKKYERSIYAKIDALAKTCQQKLAGKKISKLIIAKQVSENKFHPPTWAKRYKNHWYGAPIASLIYHDSCIDVTFKIVGSKVYPNLEPKSRLLKFIDKTRIGKKQIWSLRSNCKKGTLKLTGKVKTSSKFPVSAPIDNPIYFAAKVVAGRLLRAGVKLKPVVEAKLKADLDLQNATLLATIKSPIKDAVERANVNSLNIAAEAIFLKLGAGDWQKSSKETTKILVDKFSLTESQLAVFDGSGLSRKNKISPANFVSLLKQVTNKNYAEMFYNSLSVAGMQGTLRKRFKNKKYKGRVIAKTGYISGVVCLTGYVLDSENKPAFAFSFMVNKCRSVRDAKKMIDACCCKIIDKLDSLPVQKNVDKNTNTQVSPSNKSDSKSENNSESKTDSEEKVFG